MTALSDLLQRANDARRMSTRKRAERIDNRLHFATIADYQRGDHPVEPDESVLQALAEAYDLDLAEVQAAAAVQVGAGPWTPPPEVARLTERQQAAVTELILAIAKGASDAGQADAQKTHQDGGPPPATVHNVRHITDEAGPGWPSEGDTLPPNWEQTLAADRQADEPVGERLRREQDEAAERGHDEGDEK